MNLPSFLRRPHLSLFFATFLVALGFALYTQHAWEDYYITYRSSKNLATGHGLVFNPGDRLHTFTSPLGVLLPALTNVLVLNKSDAAALWLFRLLSIAAFAGAVTLLYACVLHLYRSVPAALLAAACLALDAKSVDFTINGMETGFLLLFIALILWAQFGPCTRRWLWLGLAWGGLMWTRPDGFLYIALLAAGGWLFNKQSETQATRRQWLKTLALAALVCTAVYLPWFAGSWLYYGTPIPHTVTVKGLMSLGDKTALGALNYFVRLPITLWTAPSSSANAAFLPSYFMFGGWPTALIYAAKTFAFIAAFAWLVPVLATSARTASFAFCGLHVYLGYYPYFPFPWYLPGSALLGFFVFAAIVAQLIAAARHRTAAGHPSFGLALKTLPVAVSASLVMFSLWLLPQVARQAAAQQQWVEDGTRRKIGEWLHAHAAPTDTVFMESLGYIGFFSNLKTYDYPGLSSREVPDAVRRVGIDWAVLIDHLWPDWIVLRPSEIERIERSSQGLLTATYQRVEEFGALDEIRKLEVHGRPWLEFDAQFVVFRRQPLTWFDSALGKTHGPFAPAPYFFEARKLEVVHAPSRVSIPIPAEAKTMSIAYGIPGPAYEGSSKTDGAAFEVRWSNSGPEQTLSYRRLDPVKHAGDRGLQTFEVDLPRSAVPAMLILKVDPGASWAHDWACWAQPEFR